MPRKTTKPATKQRRAAAEPSGLLLPPDAPAKAVVSPDSGEVATRVVTSEPAPAGAGANFEPEDRGPTVGLAPGWTPSHYEVVHAAVGGHYKGERLESGTFTDEQSWRLLAAGAIIPSQCRSEPCN